MLTVGSTRTSCKGEVPLHSPTPLIAMAAIGTENTRGRAIYSPPPQLQNILLEIGYLTGTLCMLGRRRSPVDLSLCPGACGEELVLASSKQALPIIMISGEGDTWIEKPGVSLSSVLVRKSYGTLGCLPRFGAHFSWLIPGTSLSARIPGPSGEALQPREWRSSSITSATSPKSTRWEGRGDACCVWGRFLQLLPIKTHLLSPSGPNSSFVSRGRCLPPKMPLNIGNTS